MDNNLLSLVQKQIESLSAMSIQTFLCGLAVIIFLYFLIKYIIKQLRYKLPPGPMGLHVRSMTHLSLLDHRDLYGDISSINLFGNDIVILNSADVIREAFKGSTSAVFNDRPETFMKNYVAWEDVITRSPSEKNWKELRQVMHSLLRQYGEGKAELEQIIAEELGVVIDRLHNDVGLVIDMQDYLEPSLLNVLLILLIGQRYENNHWRINEMRTGLNVNNSIANLYADTLLATFPFIRFIPIGMGATYQFIMRHWEKLLNYLLKKALKYKHTRSGIVHEMSRLKEEHTWLTDDGICGVIQDVIGAGFLTTRNSLYSFLQILLHYPDVQSRIQEEIDVILGSRQPTIDDRSSMPYTQATIIELTRYTSVLSFALPHVCTQDSELRGYDIPRGSYILPNLFRVHHDPKLWDSPWTFDPSRFLDHSGNLVPPNHPVRRQVIAFGVGKRACMGEVFAKTRLFLYITFLLQTFTFTAADELPPCDPRSFVPDMVMGPSDYQLKVVKRTSGS